jgi:hypothetical protein
MKLEKDKIYKIKHHFFYYSGRDYIICAFKEDIEIQDDFFEEYNPKRREYFIGTYDTIFTCCFDGSIITKNIIEASNPYGSSQTGISNFCKILPIDEKDYKDIRKAIVALNGKYKYNRKLNKLTYDIKA